MFNYEYITFEELYKAYIDCRKRKRTTHNCAKFELNEYENLYKLYLELNSFKYKIGRSICFIHHAKYTYKFREIFAADFRDRIVQHLLVNRLTYIFENTFIDHAFACRKNKGTDYGIESLRNDLIEITDNFQDFEQYKDYYLIKCDIKSFFPSLKKQSIWDKLKKLITSNIDLLCINRLVGKSNRRDLLFTLHLTRMILFYDCRINSIRKQPLYFWDKVEAHKSAFNYTNDNYLAIGNITSQLFANILLTDMDIELSLIYKYGRYVDDIYILVKTKEQIEDVLQRINIHLSKLSLQLNSNKTHIQPIYKSITFLGKVINKNKLYTKRQTIGNFFNRIYDHSKTLNDKNGYVSYTEFNLYKTEVANVLSSIYKSDTWYPNTLFLYKYIKHNLNKFNVKHNNRYRFNYFKLI